MIWMKVRKSIAEMERAAMILFLALLISRTAEARAFRQDVYIDQAGSGIPISFIYQGQHFDPPISITRNACTNSAGDHSTPLGVLTTAFCASRTFDTNTLASLYAPGEPTPSMSDDPEDKPEVQHLQEQMDYGPYVISIVQWSSSRYHNAVFPFATTNVGGKWYQTGSLNKDLAYGFLQNLCIQDLIESGIHRYIVSPDSGNVGPGMVRTNLYPLGTQAPPPLILQYKGQLYNPHREIRIDVPKGLKEDLATPEAALNSVFSACRAGDTNWLVSLVSPDEVDTPIEHFVGHPQTPREYIAKQMASTAAEMNAIAAAQLRQKVYYGDYAFMMYDNIHGDGTTNQDWLVFVQVGHEWFMSQRLGFLGDPVLSFFNGHGATRDYAAFKYTPSIWKY